MSEETTKEQKENIGSFKTKEEYEKAVHLLAGTEKNMVAVVEHYQYLETYVSEYLKKMEDERKIVFDDYIADILLVDLLVNDFATFIGHLKATSLTALTKMMRDELKEEKQDQIFLKLLRIEKDLEKIKDEDYYSIQLGKNIDLIIEKSKERNLEGVFTPIDSEKSEGDNSVEKEE
jgi:hypothetical protein